MPQPVETDDGDGQTYYDSIQTAIENSPEDARIHVRGWYERGEDPDGITISHRRHLSADHGTKLPSVTVATTHKRPPGPKLEGFEAPSVTLRGTKFGVLENIHTSPGGEGIRLEDTDALSCNSNRVIGCTIDRPAGIGIRLDPGAHATRIRDNRIIGGERYGIAVNGATNVVVDGNQAEDCREPGLVARKASALAVRDNYFERNSQDPSDGDCEALLAGCSGFDVGGVNRFHALDGTPPRGLSVYGNRAEGTVRRSNVFIGYENDVWDRTGGRVTLEE